MQKTIIFVFLSLFLSVPASAQRACSWQALDGVNVEIRQLNRKLTKRDLFSPEDFLGNLFGKLGEYAEQQPDAGPMPDIFRQFSDGLQHKLEGDRAKKISRLRNLRRWRVRCQHWLLQEEEYYDEWE